ncbi:hypothetical protein [Kordiimonas sp. SCSIO 12610]|uniref:hypothetical protein n=1 Tax=Kordiimonas sp. SCSIO 12610 TaxID=2829597 RepID=UPI00210D9E12|nr:hypothetical protein [Kordiimonas sp. SCSIO 12610]UTW54382.1 hypothetical protein KFF44_11210 [Kordiimonas sp. SCSIO 12610]
MIENKAMDIFLVSRWGVGILLDELNPDLECTKDTNLLVRAKTWQRGVKVANEFYAKHFKHIEVIAEDIKNGDELCNQIYHIGSDMLNDTEEVIHGPFISHGMLVGTNRYKSWYHDQDKTWRKTRK